MSRAIPLSSLTTEAREAIARYDARTERIEARFDQRVAKQKRKPSANAATLRKAKADAQAENFLRAIRHLIAPVREHRFSATRRWRFDYAWPHARVALEVEGGIWTNGAHTRGAHFMSDVTRALAILARGEVLLKRGPYRGPCIFLTTPEADRLRRILTDMDARTGRRDPTKRTARKKR